MAAPERREIILRVARDMFAHEGIDATSMRKIAAKAGVTAALLYRHFEDKDALLFAICEGYFETLLAYKDAARAKVRGNDPVDHLRTMMRAYTICGLENPREYHLTFMTGLPRLKKGPEMSRFRELLRQGKSLPEGTKVLPLGMRSFATLEQAVQAIVSAKRTRETNVAVLTEAIWAAGHGLVSLMITHEGFRWSPRERLIDVTIDMVLHGILKPN